jgi:hypothetical protein
MKFLALSKVTSIFHSKVTAKVIADSPNETNLALHPTALTAVSALSRRSPSCDSSQAVKHNGTTPRCNRATTHPKFEYIMVGFAIVALVVASANGAPANDSFASRTVLPSVSALQFEGTTIGATEEFGDPISRRVSVWYVWTSPVSGRVSMSVRSTVGLYGNVHSGDDLLTGRYITPDKLVDRGIVVRFYAIAGQAYNFCFSSAGGGSAGNFTVGLVNDGSLRAETEFVPPLANDDFASAYQVEGRNARFVQYTFNATLEPFEKDWCSKAGFQSGRGGGLWVNWEAPVSGKASFVAQSLTLAPVFLAVGRGHQIADLSLRATGQNIVTFRCKKGVTYRIYLLSPHDDQVLARIRVR